MKKYLERVARRLVNPKPKVSIVVVVYDMPEQALNTLRSLTADYQIGVERKDYEVIVVENESANMLERCQLTALNCSLRYFRRVEMEATPVHAIQFGASLARGENVCIMVDGARLLTPGVVKYLIAGHAMNAMAVVTVPGYHLGREKQQEAVARGYGADQEAELLRSIAWPDEGYRLFNIACFSSSSQNGFFLSNGESNCISMPRRLWMLLGGCDTRFNFGGGGFVNLDLYKRACEYPGVEHVMLLGEGTFHQFHGGVTTGGIDEAAREVLLQKFNEQYRQIRGENHRDPQTNPVFLGYVPIELHPFLRYSSELFMKQYGLEATLSTGPKVTMLDEEKSRGLNSKVD